MPRAHFDKKFESIEEEIAFIGEFVTENKRQKIAQVLQNRTRHLTVAVENIYQPHNASAVIRTCDCFGVQELNVIENSNQYQLNPDVSLGSQKWVDLNKFNTQDADNTTACVNALKEKGYKIVATTLSNASVTLDEFDITQPTALFFGTEKDGLTENMISQADECLYIPMVGFTQSFNISVSAAIILHHLTYKLQQSSIAWQLTDNERQEITRRWYRNIVNW